MRMLISTIMAMLLVLFITGVIAYFFLIRDNRATLEVYVDQEGVIYINGAQSTEARATALMHDPSFEVNLRYHPDSPTHYCFGACL